MNVERVLHDIVMQATRKDRATDEQPYLITDLEIIERQATKALRDLEHPKEGDVRELARRARSQAAAPDYDEQAIRDALWAVVDAVLQSEPPTKEA